MANSAEFKLSITKALTDQLEAAFASLSPSAFTAEALSSLEKRPGVYRLYLGNDLAYIGKAKSSLPARLRKHLKKISGRRNIRLDDMNFSCLYVDEDMDSVAPERMLILRATEVGLAPWNNNGFGNNDPGRERDTSEVKPDHFDASYPINLDFVCTKQPPSKNELTKFLKAFKRELPFNFRFDKSINRLAGTEIDLTITNPSARQIFELLAETLPDEWQITAFPGYVIAYPERSKFYRAAVEVW